MQLLPARTNAVTFANYCHKFWVKAKLGPKFAPDRSLPASGLSPRNLHSGKKPIFKVGLKLNMSKESFDVVQKQAFWLKHKISNSSEGQCGQISMGVLAERSALGAPQIFANIWCFRCFRCFRYLQISGAPPRAGLLVQNQYLDFICIFVPVVSSLLENTIWEQLCKY